MKYVALIFLIASNIVFAENFEHSYLCVREKAAGIILEDDQWISARLKISNEDKFIIRPLKEGDDFFEINNNTHGIFNLGVEFDGPPCKIAAFYDALICKTMIDTEIKFSEKSLRFVETSTLGYWGENLKNEGQVSVVVGSCTRI